MNKFFITTAIDYSSDVGHIANNYEKILADAIARYHRLIGDKTYFLTGTDDHGQKVEASAAKVNKTPEQYALEVTDANKEVLEKYLNISFDRFIRTEDEDHKKFVAQFYEKSFANGDIYESTYEGAYCVGCEETKNKSDLVDGRCPLHPTRELEIVKEKNFFFKLSKYQGFLEKLFKDNPQFVEPKLRYNEALNFLKKGLTDIPISRATIKWGIPVPGHPDQVIYVWFDALINYLSAGEKAGFWPADVHVVGKDINRFHSLLWPAMLQSAGYELPKKIFVHAFISLNGERISKSSGNVLYAKELTETYGIDGVRYFFLRYGSIVDDVDFTLEKLKEAYNADLANGLGNLVARVAKLAEKIEYKASDCEENISTNIDDFLKDFRVDQALEFLWGEIKEIDAKIDKAQPWKLEDDDLHGFLDQVIPEIQYLSYNLLPFIPESAEKIRKQFSGKVKSSSPLFPRVS